MIPVAKPRSSRADTHREVWHSAIPFPTRRPACAFHSFPRSFPVPRSSPITRTNASTLDRGGVCPPRAPGAHIVERGQRVCPQRLDIQRTSVLGQRALAGLDAVPSARPIRTSDDTPRLGAASGKGSRSCKLLPPGRPGGGQRPPRAPGPADVEDLGPGAEVRRAHLPPGLDPEPRMPRCSTTRLQACRQIFMADDGSFLARPRRPAGPARRGQQWSVPPEAGQTQTKSGENEALITGRHAIGGYCPPRRATGVAGASAELVFGELCTPPPSAHRLGRAPGRSAPPASGCTKASSR